MLASQTNSTRSRRARSAEDESPIIIGAIAILAVIVFSCAGMMAPVLWDAFASGVGSRWSTPSCSRATGGSDATACPDHAGLQALQPRPNAQIDPLIPNL
jgi:hypothetical protein